MSRLTVAQVIALVTAIICIPLWIWAITGIVRNNRAIRGLRAARPRADQLQMQGKWDEALEVLEESIKLYG